MPAQSPVLFDVQDRIATITLNRPHALNALDPETFGALAEIWTTVRDDPEIWVAILTGAGDRAFCAGADLKKTIPARPGPGSADIWRLFQPADFPSLDNGIDVWKPIIAAVNGYCLGGGLTLLSVCDLRVASEDATFGLPEVRRGLVPTLGATQRLARQLPYAVAMEVLLYGEHLTAPQALQHGLVNRVVPKQDVIPTARAMAQRLVAGAPLTQRAIKEAIVRGHALPLNDGIRLEGLLALAARLTDDAREGPRAFAQKRDPRYHGR